MLSNLGPAQRCKVRDLHNAEQTGKFGTCTMREARELHNADITSAPPTSKREGEGRWEDGEEGEVGDDALLQD